MEFVTTIIKALVIAFVYLIAGPALGFMIKGKDVARRITLGFMAWWLVRPPSDFTLTLYSVKSYRGHAKGFEFNFLEGIAIGLALAAILEKRKDFKWLPPGLVPYFIWILVSVVSVVAAIDPIYALMPAVKFAKMSLVFLGVFSALHDERDVKALMRGFAIALLVQLWVCLWGRYAGGGYRVTGWFEHQNPMAMWSYQIAMPILALALAKQTSRRDMLLFFSAFGAAGLVVVLTVSRAALAALGLGTIIVVAASFFEGFSARKVIVTCVMIVGGTLVMLKAADTFMARVEGAGDDSPENDLRFVLNLQSKTMLNDHPLTGIGWNNYGLANSRPLGDEYSKILEDWEANRGRAIYPENFMQNPLTESLYWLTLAETGYPGFIAFVLFFLVIFWHSLRTSLMFWKSSLGLFFFGLLAALAISALHGTVERVFTQTKNLTTEIILCAIVARGAYWRAEQKKLNSLRRAG